MVGFDLCNIYRGSKSFCYPCGVLESKRQSLLLNKIFFIVVFVLIMFPFPKWFKKATKLRIKGLSVLLLLFSGKCFLNFSVFDSVKHREKKLVSQRKNLRFFPEISGSHFTLQEKTSLQTFYTCNNFSPPPLLCSSYLRKTLLPVSLIGALTNHTKVLLDFINRININYDMNQLKLEFMIIRYSLSFTKFS
ncbi:hypothetical protein ES288_A10G109300v1 [Gossypium darwinii]|uniref:Uncharacterized protein n=1 Tax=Gossypium darwinii TaxID=34276 RepID=A0A5D2EX64_GOSDA|nr:hypothetical protein ES288_A10G109300v1 [Gossypium darwinii]